MTIEELQKELRERIVDLDVDVYPKGETGALIFVREQGVEISMNRSLPLDDLDRLALNLVCLWARVRYLKRGEEL